MHESKSASHLAVSDPSTSWTVAHWASMFVKFSRQEYWCALPPEWQGRLHSLCQGLFLTQELNLGLPHWKWILDCLSHQESLSVSDYSIFLLYWAFCYMYCLLSLVTFCSCCFKVCFSHIRIATPVLFWLLFAWNLFPCSICLSLDLKWVSCSQHIVGPFSYILPIFVSWKENRNFPSFCCVQALFLALSVKPKLRLVTNNFCVLGGQSVSQKAVWTPAGCRERCGWVLQGMRL